mgnify:CR=1 FL=1
MKTNHTIKKAVTAALTILALGTQNQALALGLAILMLSRISANLCAQVSKYKARVSLKTNHALDF